MSETPHPAVRPTAREPHAATPHAIGIMFVCHGNI